MRNVKKLLALALVFVMLLLFAGCHKKDEIAVTVGDVKFTSAYYMCALINADFEAKNKVDENLSEEESASEVDYYSKKIDGAGYVEWVEKTALENLKERAAYKILCDENKLELDKEKLSEAETYASYYWSSYGYSAYFEPNGVGQKTYTQYMKDSYYAERYFEYLYGKDGEKAIASDKVLETMYGKFVIANVIDAAYDAEMTDNDKTDLKTKLENYLKDLKTGKKTFEDVYKEYYEVKEEQEETTDSKEPQPKDKYATVIGAEDTVYENEYYEEISKMAIGEIKLIEKKEKAGLMLVVKQDIKADPYYTENLDMASRHLIADEEFEKNIAEYAKKLKTDVNKYAVGQFKVKKIIEPSYQ